MDIDITTLTRAPGEDPNDTAYAVVESEVGGFKEGDKVRVIDIEAARFVGEAPERIFTINGFFVIEGEVCALFREVSATGHADMSGVLAGLTHA